MSIFEEMHSYPRFGSWQDYDELQRRLKQAIADGLVKEIAPSSDMQARIGERWFVENNSGVVFQLIEPNPPAQGCWAEVQFPQKAVN